MGIRLSKNLSKFKIKIIFELNPKYVMFLIERESTLFPDFKRQIP